jgi:hypothetical protein
VLFNSASQSKPDPQAFIHGASHCLFLHSRHFNRLPVWNNHLGYRNHDSSNKCRCSEGLKNDGVELFCCQTVNLHDIVYFTSTSHLLAMTIRIQSKDFFCVS